MQKIYLHTYLLTEDPLDAKICAHASRFVANLVLNFQIVVTIATGFCLTHISLI